MIGNPPPPSLLVHNVDLIQFRENVTVLQQRTAGIIRYYINMYTYKCFEKFSQIRMSQNSGPKKSLVSCWTWSLNMMMSIDFCSITNPNRSSSMNGCFHVLSEMNVLSATMRIRVVNPLPLSLIHTQRLYSWKKRAWVYMVYAGKEGR